MATPLYKRFKNNGTTLYVFPSSAYDDSLANNKNSNYKMNFTKFVCLNIPKRDEHNGILNFSDNFYPAASVPETSKFSDLLINSLRNYVANADSTFHNSSVGDNDFYNINEITTPTEMLFWKWIKKLGILDLEPAQHNIDWDKYNDDFVNNNKPNVSAIDYFQKYLWKEREIIEYNASIINNAVEANTYQINVNNNTVTNAGDVKFKPGDKIFLKSSSADEYNKDVYGTIIKEGVNNHHFSSTSSETIFNILVSTLTSFDASETIHVKLDYNRLIEYIGEVQLESTVQTGKLNYNEKTAYIQHHEGKTPTILFKIEDNNKNYYPNLELPIMDNEKIPYIIGSENINSPIVTNPSQYPGDNRAIFDKDTSTGDDSYTYLVSIGDSERYSGDYFGITIEDNIGLDSVNYFERLDDFNSDGIDGMKLDFDLEHYYKAKFAENEVSNFTEFNSAVFDEKPPEDFKFNAILWYYTMDDGTTVTENLYGIEFLDSPANDSDGTISVDENIIPPINKLVSNGNQDGMSYIFNLITTYDIDNNQQPLIYDPEVLNNSTGFDLYNEILKTNVSLYESFQTIIKHHEYYSQELERMKSIIYTQTQFDIIKNRLDNLDTLMTLYSKLQMVDSETIKIEIDDDGNYPKIKAHVRQKEFTDVNTYKTQDIYDTFVVDVTNKYNIELLNKPLIIIQNDIQSILTLSDDIKDKGIPVLFDRELEIGESFDVLIEPAASYDSTKFAFYIMFENNDFTITEEKIFDIKTPVDILQTSSGNEFANSYYSNTLLEEYMSYVDIDDDNSTQSKIWTDTLHIPLFRVDDYVYVDNLYMKDDSSGDIVDYSGVYKIMNDGITNKNFSYYTIDLDSSGKQLYTYPRLTYYKGVKYHILRVDESNESIMEDRYRITKELIN